MKIDRDEFYLRMQDLDETLADTADWIDAQIAKAAADEREACADMVEGLSGYGTSESTALRARVKELESALQECYTTMSCNDPTNAHLAGEALPKPPTTTAGS